VLGNEEGKLLGNGFLYVIRRRNMLSREFDTFGRRYGIDFLANVLTLYLDIRMWRITCEGNSGLGRGGRAEA
jgi:hypothetical protein